MTVNKRLKNGVKAVLLFASVFCMIFTGACGFKEVSWYEQQTFDVQKGTNFTGTLETGNVTNYIEQDGITTEIIKMQYNLTISENPSEMTGYTQIVATFKFNVENMGSWLAMPGVVDKYTGKLFNFGSSVGENSQAACMQYFKVGKETYQLLGTADFDKDAGTVIYKIDVPTGYDGLWFFLSSDDTELERAVAEDAGKSTRFDKSPYVGSAGEVLKKYTQYWFEYVPEK